MKTEKNYEFRNDLRIVHKANRRDDNINPADNEIIIKKGWKIIWSKTASQLIANSAKDLHDYFITSMGISLLLEEQDSVHSALTTEQNCIILADKEDLPELGKDISVPRSHVIEITDGKVIICGNDARGVMAGVHYLEDVMNLKEAPILEKQTPLKREPLFSPRMVHSGWGIDEYPDQHLNAIAHAGFDSVLLFVKGVDQTTIGHLDFNDLIARAASFGLDVYFYSYLDGWKHPDDADAQEHFFRVYGKLFEKCPDAKGIILVGESCEFPSKDPSTSGKKWRDTEAGILNTKPSPGWWPCRDYPQWVDIVKRSVKKASPDAEVVFWTYNWGYTPEKERVRLIESLPDDITLLVTFEMFDFVKRENIVNPVMDYTISFPGPGKYFTSEAEAASKRNIRLYTMCNTGGMTWDFAVVPYIPTPYQWMKRYDGLHMSREKWQLAGLMESHHYGWYPSAVSEISKWSFWSPETDLNKMLENIAVRDFGAEAAPFVLSAWQSWSEAMPNCISSNEDQYGPFRTGPSYPLIFHPNITRTLQGKEIAFPTQSQAYMGNSIIKTFYQPYENVQQSPGPFRIPVEIRSLEKMLTLWSKGVADAEAGLSATPDRKLPAARKLLGLGKFIRNSIITTINVKKWWLLNTKLMAESDVSKSLEILNQLEEIAKAEINNAKDTIPIVEADSRLGWEPSMEYVTDNRHLEWKIKQVMGVLEIEIPDYRKMLDTVSPS